MKASSAGGLPAPAGFAVPRYALLPSTPDAPGCAAAIAVVRELNTITTSAATQMKETTAGATARVRSCSFHWNRWQRFDTCRSTARKTTIKAPAVNRPGPPCCQPPNTSYKNNNQHEKGHPLRECVASACNSEEDPYTEDRRRQMQARHLPHERRQQQLHDEGGAGVQASRLHPQPK
jgi:hypothetical protein